MAVKPEAAVSYADGDLRARLLRALAETHLNAPRPLANLELPKAAEHLLDADVIAGLRPAAVLVPVVQRASGLQVLFTVRGNDLRHHAGQISFPGGSCESGDQNAVATALRESQEEIGLDPAYVETIGYLDDYPTITGFRITPIVGLVADGITVAPDQVEVSEIFEVPLTQLLNKNNYARKYLERKDIKLPYYCVTHGGHSIWGATAAMLWNMQDKINKTA